MTDQEQAQRGRDVMQMLESPLFLEAWEALRKRLVSIMETAATDEGTLKAKTCIGLLNDLRQHWVLVAKNGVVAAENIRLEEEQKKGNR